MTDKLAENRAKYNEACAWLETCKEKIRSYKLAAKINRLDLETAKADEYEKKAASWCIELADAQKAVDELIGAN